MKKEIIEIPYDTEATFLSRENRFLGKVEIEGSEEVKLVHVRDPGRLKEVLYEGNEVLLKKVDKKDRKTDYDLVAGKVGDDWILVNSGYHRMIVEKIFEDDKMNPIKGMDSFKAEQKLGESRIDFLVDRNGSRAWVEVKGCTLAKDGVALFPDAPTTRGKRHLEELIKIEDHAAVIFLIFRPDAKCFLPYKERDPDFSSTFYEAIDSGVEIHAVQVEYVDGVLYYKGEIPICEDDRV